METIDVTYTPGTIKNPQQTKITKSAFIATDGVHFPDGRLSTIPPFSDVTPPDVPLLGGCRSIHGVELSAGFPGFYYLFGTNTRLYVFKNGNLTNITPLQTSTDALGNDPLNITNGSNVIVVTHTSHGFADGDRIAMSGIASDLNGIPQAQFNAEHIITYINANSYSFETADDATSTDATAGGAAVEVAGQIAAGALNQSFPSGYGGGDYGSGLYGSDLESVTGLYAYPRIWSFDDFGNEVVMCPGDDISGDGQKIYIWDGDASVAPTVLSGAPTDCRFVFVLNNAVVALCGKTVKISELGNGTAWTPGAGSTAYINTLQRINKLVCGYRFNEKKALLFTENEVLLLQYVGEPDYWDISDLYGDDGIIGPQAACSMNSVLYWRGINNSYRYSGGYVEVLPNDQNGDYLTNGINYSQGAKSFAVPDLLYGQVYFHSPFEADNEPDDYVIYNPRGDWTLGTMSRTAGMKKFIGGKNYFAQSTSETVAGSIWRHFQSDLTLPMTWSAQTAESYAGDGSKRFAVTKFYPDSYQGGDINVSHVTREYAQSAAEYEEPVSVVTSTTEYVSTMAAGRLRRIKFSGETQMTLGAWKEEIQMLGGN